MLWCGRNFRVRFDLYWAIAMCFRNFGISITAIFLKPLIWNALKKSGVKVNAALAAQDTATVLFVLFDRLYTLRNQMVHGGATYNSSANREQLKDACKILGSILPVMLSIIQKNADKELGQAVLSVCKEVDMAVKPQQDVYWTCLSCGWQREASKGIGYVVAQAWTMWQMWKSKFGTKTR